MLERLFRVRTVERRNMSLSGGAAVLFATQRGSLHQLLLASTFRSASTASLICLCHMRAYPTLRTLAVNARELAHLRAGLPPALEELVVSFAPYSAWQRRAVCPSSVLTAVHCILVLAPSAPMLRSVRLSDEVRAQITAWRVAAFLLRETIAPARVAVEVNLHLYWEDLRWVRMRLRAERYLFALYG